MDLTQGYFIAEHKVRDECGVFGIYAPGSDVARMAYFGLFAQQHRGQESAGITVSTGFDLITHKAMGLVTQVFKEETLQLMKGSLAVGHVRYSTTGSSTVENAQPLVVQSPHGPVAIAHNGNLINTKMLRREVEDAGATFVTSTDSEVIAHLIALTHADDLESAVRQCMTRLEGAYSLVLATPSKMIGIRDPYGIRPLCIGKLGPGEFVLASESCGLSIVGAEFVREVEPGEMIIIDQAGMRSVQGVPPTQPSMCVFEYIYFARPDTQYENRSLLSARNQMGQILAQEHPVEADIVIAVPDSGTPAAVGYSSESGIPFAIGLIKNHYVQRTFIQPMQSQRELGIKMKLNPVVEVIKGKRIILVDDSIVRGTTSKKIVKLLKDAGAKEIHMRISSPPVKHPCHYGIDMASQKELMAANTSVEGIRQHLGCESLGYLSLSGLMKAIGKEGQASSMCHACFSGDYPMQHVEQLGFEMEPVL